MHMLCGAYAAAHRLWLNRLWGGSPPGLNFPLAPLVRNPTRQLALGGPTAYVAESHFGLPPGCAPWHLWRSRLSARVIWITLGEAHVQVPQSRFGRQFKGSIDSSWRLAVVCCYSCCYSFAFNARRARHSTRFFFFLLLLLTCKSREVIQLTQERLISFAAPVWHASQSRNIKWNTLQWDKYYYVLWIMPRVQVAFFAASSFYGRGCYWSVNLSLHHCFVFYFIFMVKQSLRSRCIQYCSENLYFNKSIEQNNEDRV